MVKREFVFTKKDFNQLASLVGDETGIALAESKQNMVYARIARRLRALEFEKFTEYIDYLKGPDGHEEVEDFVNAVTTNLTHFFREPHHFEHVLDKVLIPMEAEPPQGKKKIRIWSAGCSAGMEAYSIAMMVLQAIPDIKKWDVKILATDIDTNMIEYGKKAVYHKKDVEKIPAKYRHKYTRRLGGTDADEFEMVDEIKKIVHFKHLNLMEKWPVKGPFDIIFCRNVMIYFDDVTCAQLFDHFSEVQQHGGWLYIGHSETIGDLCNKYELYKRTIYRREVILG